ncbi:MAG: hypothetical protein AAGU27_26700 [Dehalobacterium sp.]
MTDNLILIMGAAAYAYAIGLCIRYKVNGIQKPADIKPKKQAEPASLVAPIYSLNMK